MVAAMDATGSGVLTGKSHQVGDARLPADVLVARDGRRAAVLRGQQRDSRRVRSEDRQPSCGQKTLGTLQKGSPVLADGKLYVGTENGKFYILRPTATGAEVARRGPDRHGGQPRADRRLAHRCRRPHLRGLDAAAEPMPNSAGHVYAIGPGAKSAAAAPPAAAPAGAGRRRPGPGVPARSDARSRCRSRRSR